MPNINKLLSKVNQASQAIKSAKGIKAQISSAGYKGGVNTEEVDKLQEQAEENRRKLEERRGNLQKQLSSTNTGKRAARKPPSGFIDMQYPIEADFDNFLVFETRPRKERKGGNMLSEARISIALPLPSGGWNQEAEASYEVTEIGAFARGVMKSGQTAGGMIEETINAAKGFVQNAMGSMGGGIKNLKSGQASNPMQEQTFDKIEFRDHSFDWEFMPRSLEEAKLVNKIVAAFKVAMLPDTFASYSAEEKSLLNKSGDNSPSENFYNYPNVFDVYVEGPLAKQVDRFLPMVCKSVTVGEIENDDYLIASDSDTQWSGSKSLSLSFSEIKIMSQETFATRVVAESTDLKDLGSISNATGSASILDTETAPKKSPPTPKT